MFIKFLVLGGGGLFWVWGGGGGSADFIAGIFLSFAALDATRKPHLFFLEVGPGSLSEGLWRTE